MSMIDQTRTEERTITAFFDTRDMAERASRDLVNAGIVSERIRIVEGAETGTTQAVAPADTKTFWESLKDLFLPEEDRYVYAEGLRRGGYLLTVRTSDSHYDKVLDILDREGSVDMNERESTWRSEGWRSEGWQHYAKTSRSSTDTAAFGATSGTAARTTGTSDFGQSAKTGAAAKTALGSKAAAETLATGKDDVVSLTEEQIQIGKRDVSHGKVRLRTYVVETPVNEQVNLRSESIQVTRRPVDRAVTATDTLFQDRVIEAEERAEEAVVSKTARVTEEVSLRKTAETQTQTISDSLRHTEVEIDDSRSGRGVAASNSNKQGISAQTTAMIAPHMDVIASDGQKVGTVDHMEGQDKIKLAKSTSPDGQHHFIPLAWVDHVDRHVHLNRPRNQVQQGW